MYQVRAELEGRTSAIVNLGAFGTKAEAEARRTWARLEIAAGRVPDRETVAAGPAASGLDRRTVRAIIDAWLPSLLDISDSTRRSYTSCGNAIAEDFGARLAVRLTPAAITTWLSDLMAEDLAPATIKLRLTVLQLALDHAGIDPNPARDRRVRPPAIKREAPYLPPRADLAKVRAAMPAKYRPAFQLYERGGLTLREVEATTWPNPADPILRVAGTKRAARARVVRDLGEAYGGDAALLEGLTPADIAALPTGRNFAHALAQAIKRTGVRPFTPHTFRHLHITRMHHADMPMAAIAARVGHGSVATTIKVYTHLLPPD